MRFLLLSFASLAVSVGSFAQQTSGLSAIPALRDVGVAHQDSGVSKPELYSRDFSGGLKTDEAEASATPAANAGEPANPEPAYRLRPVTAPIPAREFESSHRRAWLVLTAAQHGSALFDAWSTRQALLNGRGYERDVLVRPFANSPAIYPALQIVPLGLDFLSHRMLRSSRSFNRKMWWVPQAVATAGFVWCGTRNLRVAR